MNALGGFFSDVSETGTIGKQIDGINGCAVYAKRATECAHRGGRKGFFCR
jgi:hypothetical protein